MPDYWSLDTSHFDMEMMFPQQRAAAVPLVQIWLVYILHALGKAGTRSGWKPWNLMHSEVTASLESVLWEWGHH